MRGKIIRLLHLVESEVGRDKAVYQKIGERLGVNAGLMGLEIEFV